MGHNKRHFPIRGTVPGPDAPPISNIYQAICDTRKSTEALLKEVALMSKEVALMREESNSNFVSLIEVIKESTEEMKTAREELSKARTEMAEESHRLLEKMDEI